MSLQSLLLDTSAPLPEATAGTITKSVSQLDRMIHEIRTTIFDLQTTGISPARACADACSTRSAT